MHPDDAAAERFFAEVSDALRPLAPERRAEILADLRAHAEIRRRQSSLPIQALLGELGTPEQIAADAGVEGAVARPAPAGAGRDLWSWIALTATVFVWPLGIVMAAVSGRWRASAVAYAAITAALGSGFDLFTFFSSFRAQSGHQITCRQGVCVTTPSASLMHPLPHGLAVATGIIVLVVASIGAPLVAAVHLARTERHPEAKPWLPVATWAVILLGTLGLVFSPGA